VTARRASTTLAAAALLLGGVASSGLPTAQATPIGDANSRAAALRLQVDALQTKAEIATEEYDAAYAKLGAAVTAHLSAQRDLDNATQAATSSGDEATQRVRALYMTGGATALYATALDSSSITEVARRLHQVNVVLGADRLAENQAATVVARRADAEKRLAAAAVTSTVLQKQVAHKSDEVRSLLARTSSLLAAADQYVRDLAEQQRRAVEAAAAARAAALFNAPQYNGPDLPPVAASPLATAVLAFARTQLGKPYVWGATGPGSYDCSGFTGAAYAAAGLNLPRTSREQWYAGPHVALSALEPGDLMFWGYDVSDPGTIHHVAIYAGDGQMAAAPHSGDVVKVQPIYLDGYLGAVRPGATVA
jgi:cell wall-associated NlpC family hydrolase